MATTRLIPLHIGKGNTVSAALSGSLEYIEDPDKTEGGELISSYECDVRTADSEFQITKNMYAQLTGRDQGERNVIAYHTRQSFLPGEITSAEANRIGYELAMRFTKGHNAFVVCTHTDKHHIHNHIIWNSTDLDCKRKFRNFIGSSFALRRCSDRLCLENGLSVVKNPKPSRGHYGTWQGEQRDAAPNCACGRETLSFQEKLRQAIDAALEQKPKDFDAFLSLMKDSGYEVKLGKHIKFTAPGQKQGTRCDTLRGDHTEEAIQERIAGIRIAAPRSALPKAYRKEQVNLLIDIQQKIQDGKGKGYKQWAAVFNLKSLSQTFIYLEKHNALSYPALEKKSADATERFNELSSQIKELESKLTANADLQKHIVSYSKTRAVYVEYRKAGYSKKFKAAHEADILLHQTAKKTFDELGLEKLPAVASLRGEYASLLAEKKKAYGEYAQAKVDMRELLIAKANVQRLLELPAQEREQEIISPDR